VEESVATPIRRIECAPQVLQLRMRGPPLADDLFRIIAGVDQSIRRSTRKPRLNHDENR